jgi:hypothetical protein
VDCEEVIADPMYADTERCEDCWIIADDAHAGGEK